MPSELMLWATHRLDILLDDDDDDITTEAQDNEIGNRSDGPESEPETPTPTGNHGILAQVQLINPTIPVCVSHSRLGYY